MKRYRFAVEEHQEYGGLGFRPLWYPHGEPLHGVAVAHDILEHFAHDDGSAEGELQALGAALYIRGDNGYFQRNGNQNRTETHIGADLELIWRAHTERDGFSTLRKCGVMRYHETMQQCRNAVSSGLQSFEEIGLELPSTRDREYMARWIAKGYKRAQRRYAKHDSYTIAYSVFSAIEEQAEELLGRAQEGMVLTVCVDFHSLAVSLECDYPRGEYA